MPLKLQTWTLHVCIFYYPILLLSVHIIWVTSAYMPQYLYSFTSRPEFIYLIEKSERVILGEYCSEFSTVWTDSSVHTRNYEGLSWIFSIKVPIRSFHLVDKRFYCMTRISPRVILWDKSGHWPVQKSENIGPAVKQSEWLRLVIWTNLIV